MRNCSSKMKEIAFIILATIVAGCLYGVTGKQMSVDELMKDGKQNIDNENFTYTYDYKSLNDGDTVIIKDTIHSKEIRGNDTFLTFESNSTLGMYFIGNLTDFNAGDKVKIVLHISRDTFVKTYGAQTWSFDFEIFEEGWDFDQHIPIPFPPSVIKHVR